MSSDFNSPSVGGLANIQKNFNEYQTKAFPKREPQFFALEVCGECGELANIEKKIWRDPTKKDELSAQLGLEAADVFISLINYANSRGINLEKEVAEKLREIEKRRKAGKMGKTQ